MGMIRKTASIGTLGLVSFRSKEEKLRRAEADRDTAAADLVFEHKARELAEDRVLAAEKKAHEAEVLALKAAAVRSSGRGRPSRRAKAPRPKHRLFRRSRAGGAAAIAGRVVASASSAGDRMRPGIENLEGAVGRRARKARAGAEAQAARARGNAVRARQQAHAQAQAARARIEKQAAKARRRSARTVEDVGSATASAVESVSERVSALVD